MTSEQLDRFVRGEKHIAILFICPTCNRAHEPKDLGTSFQCVSCERGLPTEYRPRCPDCTSVRVPADDSLWFLGPVPEHGPGEPLDSLLRRFLELAAPALPEWRDAFNVAWTALFRHVVNADNARPVAEAPVRAEGGESDLPALQRADASARVVRAQAWWKTVIEHQESSYPPSVLSAPAEAVICHIAGEKVDGTQRCARCERVLENRFGFKAGARVGESPESQTGGGGFCAFGVDDVPLCAAIPPKENA